ncbi:exo-alpha-sialidase [Hyalangium versicolor]|uniref:exo-alpha-sialidase n=1 Tax=Hyalangium versicolor TaxID=2861190 RepID=UPI001CCAEDB1|nr:exo-alpha-sialidase [Hyalangium versicolor]
MKSRLLKAWGLVLVGMALVGSPAGAQTGGPIYNGSELDYQPSPLRLLSGDLMVVIERLAAGTNSGDLYLTISRDEGATWSEPRMIVGSSLNERHPALVRLPNGSFAVFYLVAEGGGVYRIHRSTSSNGRLWFARGPIDLGWSTHTEVNPTVIREDDGSLTMTYHRLSGPSYIARSLDGGATWDTQKTQVSDGTAALPRITRRASDGLYVVTYQVNASGGRLELYSKASYDPYDWSGPASVVSSGSNSHDSQPLTLEDGNVLVTYIEQTGSNAFDVYYRTSADGLKWSAATRVTSTPSTYDVEPHPVLQGTPGYVTLFWSYQNGATPYVDHDIWMMKDLPITLAR